MGDRFRAPAFLALMAAASGVAAAGDAEKAVALVDRLNDRWTGATATMRVSIPLKDDADRDGWYESRWMMHDSATNSDDAFLLKIRISDWGPIRHAIADDTLLAGTRFRALGWRFEDPDRAKGLKLELEFVDAPVRMEWRFSRRGFSLAAKIEADELVYIERYMRLEAFDVQGAEEGLVAVAAPATPTPRPPPPTATPFSSHPDLANVSVEVVPPRALPGEWVRLVVVYDVVGLRPGETRQVTEVRRLAVGDRPIEAFEHQVWRPSGHVTSELPILVPRDAAPGIYTVGVTLRLSGAPPGSAAAAFLVMATGGPP
jgi:dipeptidyl aminopeptidase/acylaminoacyl peptidase